MSGRFVASGALLGRAATVDAGPGGGRGVLGHLDTQATEWTRTAETLEASARRLAE